MGISPKYCHGVASRFGDSSERIKYGISTVTVPGSKHAKRMLLIASKNPECMNCPQCVVNGAAQSKHEADRISDRRE